MIEAIRKLELFASNIEHNMVRGFARSEANFYRSVASQLTTLTAERDKLKEEKEKLLEVLKALTDEIGWRGVGPHDDEILYCELCGASHEDCSKIMHTSECAIGAAAALIKELEGE